MICFAFIPYPSPPIFHPMGQLTLIRHGQARAFEQDSDRLTELGKQQAQALGEYWVRNGVVFDEVYCGTLTRQQHTAELVGACFDTAKAPWPKLSKWAELNEYDADGLIHRLAPALAERDTEFRGLAEAYQRYRQSSERNRYFQKMFEAVTVRWLGGEIEAAGVEPWAVFRERVRGAFKRIINQEGSGRHVGVFTSGGVIGLLVQTALQAPETKALEINWRVRNCSLTEFTFSRDRLAFDSFNALPHLGPELRTFR